MADIKTRFTIEGEQQYRKAMNDAASAVKVLNSQQKLAKAQFQNTGDAEKYAAQQADILRKKIEQQKTSVKAAEAALKQLSDQGVAANNRQMQQWQVKLNNAQTALEQMEAELKEVNSTMQQTGSAAQETSSAVESIGQKVSYDAVINGLGRITGAMGSAAQKAKELAGELISTMKDAAAWSDDLATQATVYGISTEELQRMQYTATLIDTSVESIMKSRQKLVNNMVYGNDEIQNSFKELGVVTQELFDGKYGPVAGEYRNWEDVFWDLGEALMNMEDVELRNATANKLLGKSFDELLPLFDNDWAEKGYKSAREYYEATKDSWQVVSDENVARLNALDDTVQKVENNFTTLKGTILGELAPAFTEVGNTVADLLAEFNEYLNSPEGQQKLGELSDAVSGLFTNLTDIDFGTALDTAKGAIQALTDGLTWIRDNWTAVQAGLVAIGGAFGAMTITKDVLEFMQLLSSGKFLFGKGGGGGSSPTTTTTTPATPPASKNLLESILGSDVLRYATATGAALTTLFWDPLFKPHTNGMSWFESNEEKQAYYDSNPEIKAEAAAQQMSIWADRLADSIKKAIDPSKWFGGGWYITEDVNLDDTPFLNISPAQWEAAEQYWDTIREFGMLSPQEGQAYQDMLDRFVLEGDELEGWQSLAETIEAIYGLKNSGFTGENLPDWWINQDLWPKDEEVDMPVVPTLPEDAAAQMQAVLDGMALTVPVVPAITGGEEGEGRANGLPYVPFDGYPAILHKGERVVPAREISSRSYSSNLYVENMNMNGGADAEGLAAAMAAAQRRTMAGFGS